MKTEKQLEKLEKKMNVLSFLLKSHLEKHSDRRYVFSINNDTEELHICNIYEDDGETRCSEILDDDYLKVSPAFTANDIRLIAGYLEKKQINGYGDIHICGNCIRSLYGDKDY